MSDPLVAIVCEHPGVVLGVEYAPGTILELPAAEADRILRVWTQVGSQVVYYFKRVEDHAVADALKQEQERASLPPIPGDLDALSYDKVVALAKAHGLATKNVSKLHLVASLRAIAEQGAKGGEG